MIEALMMGELFDSGEAVFLTSGTYQWLVPEGVTSVSVVAVGPGGFGNTNPVAQRRNIVRYGAFEMYAWGGVTSYFGSGTTGALGGDGVGGDGGGVGGQGGSIQGGGGGAAGYTGNGGMGGSSGSPTGQNGTGGGGKGGNFIGGSDAGFRGGGASIYGPSGGGTYLFGGGLGGYPPTRSTSGSGGGGLRYANNIPVTPGTTIEVVIDNPLDASPSSLSLGINGAVRIIWGAGRKFPIDLVSQSNSKVVYTY